MGIHGRQVLTDVAGWLAEHQHSSTLRCGAPAEHLRGLSKPLQRAQRGSRALGGLPAPQREVRYPGT